MTRARTAAILALTAVTAALAALAAVQPDPIVTPGILVSRQLLDSRQLKVGDTVRLSADPSGANSRSFRIDGVYEPVPDPMRFAQQHLEARLHLPDLLNLTAPEELAPAAPRPPDEGITSINVRLTDGADAQAFANDVTARLPGIIARPTSAPDERTSTFVVLERFHLAIAIVTVVGSAVFLLALMVMLVDERRETVGTLRLIGFTRRRILVQVFTEGAIIAIAGAIFGVAFAIASQGLFNRFFQWRYDTSLIFLRISADVVWQSLLIAVPLGIAASLIASWTLLRRPILALVRR